MYIEYFKEYMASITLNAVYVKAKMYVPVTLRFAFNKIESVRFPTLYITLCDVVLIYFF